MTAASLLLLALSLPPDPAPEPQERRPCYWYCAQWEEVCDLNDTTGNLRCWRQCRRLERDCGERDGAPARSTRPGTTTRSRSKP